MFLFIMCPVSLLQSCKPSLVRINLTSVYSWVDKWYVFVALFPRVCWQFDSVLQSPRMAIMAKQFYLHAVYVLLYVCVYYGCWFSRKIIPVFMEMQLHRAHTIIAQLCHLISRSVSGVDLSNYKAKNFALTQTFLLFSHNVGTFYWWLQIFRFSWC